MATGSRSGKQGALGPQPSPAASAIEKSLEIYRENVAKEEGDTGKIKEPRINTRHLFLTTGVTSLAPYKIKETATATGFDGSPATGNPNIYYLEDSSEIDVLGFIEIRFRKNLAWDRAALPVDRRRSGRGWSLACDGADGGINALRIFCRIR